MALFKVEFYSSCLDMHTDMTVILPQQPTNKESKEIKLKTIYLLHGRQGSHSVWSRFTAIERYAREKGVAVVMPSAHNTYYTNMPYRFRYLDFISKELPSLCRQFFPQLSIDAKDNIIAGNSMGGYGALKIGLLNPEAFGTIGCFSGAYDIADLVQNSGEGTKDFYNDLFVDEETIKATNNDLFEIAKANKNRLNNPRVYMACGEQDYLLEHSQKMSKCLKDDGYDITYVTSQGAHNWEYWDEQLEQFFNWLFQQNII